jgi:uncharacterized membrane protein YgcG
MFGIEEFDLSDVLRSLTVFISFRNAAILSGPTIPTAGIPRRRVETLGFSTGVGACFSEARADANKFGSEVPTGKINFFGGGGGGSGGGGGGDGGIR